MLWGREKHSDRAACMIICFSNMTRFEQVISFEKGDAFKVKTTLRMQQIFETIVHNSNL